MSFEKLAGVAYGEGWIRIKGGVAWAKQVAASVDPGAVGYQIAAYQQAASQIAYAQKVLKNTQGNLDSSWTGEAAAAAQQTFQGAINHAQLVQDTINQDIVPRLQTVQQAQYDFIDAMASVPDEKPLTRDALLYEGTKSFVTYPTNFSGRVLVEHNTAARTQAAAALTKLTGTYSGAAAQLSGLTAGSRFSGTAQDNTSTFDLGQASSSAGNGAASRYRQKARSSTSASGARSNPAVNTSPGRTATTGGGTRLASSGRADSNPLAGIPAPSPVSVGTQPTEILPVGSQLPVTGGYSRGNDPVAGGEGARGGATEFGSGSSDGLTTGGTGTGRRTQSGTLGNNDGESLIERGSQPIGESASADAVESSSRGGLVSEGASALGGLGPGSGATGRTSSSSRYGRGRYFDEPADEDAPMPAVRSVFEDATDGQGNSLNLLSRRSALGRDDRDERGKRPSNLKEDGSWDSAQRIVPPVIE